MTETTDPRLWKKLLAAGSVGSLALLTACGGDDDNGGGHTVDNVSVDTEEAQAAAAECDEITQLDVSLGWIMNVEWAGFYIAEQNGYYAEECLDINWIQGGPNAASTMQNVSSGQAHIGVEPSMPNWLQDVVNGEDFVAIGSMFYDTPGAILSLAENPMESAEDLQGATILGQEGTRPMLDGVFGAAGMEPDYNFVSAGYDADPLVNGDGDALTVYATNQPIMLEQQYGMTEDDYVVTTYADLGLPQYGCLIYANGDTLEEMSEEMEGFLRASARGWLENEEDPEVAANLAVDVYGADLDLDLEQQIRENEIQIPFVRGPLADDELFYIDTERWGGEVYEGFEIAEMIEGELPNPEDVVDMTFLEAAYAE
ncbi:ABC transporter substrate-binding protein [Nesterenkonia flava]|uniref:Thiamine pyrimidine synthase n=1 Tax=Nesterenkonia flava TaxID=469799 RepID=A0ABU1FWL5_9MICC|nr:ABC transporter substrate-binding protein [Nesterenkonia flava]MDR5712511.1 ABC transporter substrate-binding protein [Nesterenkonia flava]